MGGPAGFNQGLVGFSTFGGEPRVVLGGDRGGEKPASTAKLPKMPLDSVDSSSDGDPTAQPLPSESPPPGNRGAPGGRRFGFEGRAVMLAPRSPFKAAKKSQSLSPTKRLPKCGSECVLRIDREDPVWFSSSNLLAELLRRIAALDVPELSPPAPLDPDRRSDIDFGGCEAEISMLDGASLGRCAAACGGSAGTRPCRALWSHPPSMISVHPGLLRGGGPSALITLGPRIDPVAVGAQSSSVRPGGNHAAEWPAMSVCSSAGLVLCPTQVQSCTLPRSLRMDVRQIRQGSGTCIPKFHTHGLRSLRFTHIPVVAVCEGYMHLPPLPLRKGPADSRYWYDRKL